MTEQTDSFRRTRLKDGREVLLRLQNRDDFDRSLEFFRRLPDGERLFMRRNVTQRDVLAERFEEVAGGLSTVIVAEAAGLIVADALLYVQPQGWFRKTGEVRLYVDPAWRGVGLGSTMVREVFALAVRKGLKKLEAALMGSQEGTIELVEKLGFVREGALEGFVVDSRGREHDLVLMGLAL